MEEFNEEFYIKLLKYYEHQFSTEFYQSVQFYWGVDKSGKYYWGDRNAIDIDGDEYIKLTGFSSAKETVESIFDYLVME